MSLLQRFNKALKANGVKPSSQLLLALSGGMDSVVLFHLLRESRYTFAAAHVNYGLRGQASDGDEAFARTLCGQHGVEFFTAYRPIHKEQMNEGLQNEARNIRYAWFAELCEVHAFDLVLTAHHMNDRIETFFMSLLRGSGLKGLKSIPAKSGNIIRPLLPFDRSELQQYARYRQLEWREDESNLTLDYLRNEIRHGLAQQYGALSAVANENAGKSIGFLVEANDYFEREARTYIDGLDMENGIFGISDEGWAELFRRKPIHKYVFDLLGFSAEKIPMLEQLGKSQSGKFLAGAAFTVYRDRGRFMFESNRSAFRGSAELITESGAIEAPISLSWDRMEAATAHTADRRVIQLDRSKLDFPLRVRGWQDGDRFVPLGMSGQKKISDFLIDQKIPIPEKNRILVLLSGDAICWVIGHRVDDRFKVDSSTRAIVKFILT